MASLGPAVTGEQVPGAEAEPGAAGPPAPSTSSLGPLLPLKREPLYNWQATKASLKERFAFLFNSELLSDVRFVLGKGRGGGAAGGPQRIPAHRFVLAAGSAVFDAMFNGGMATTSAEIELPDVEPAAFLALLRFLYSDEVQIGPETVMTTLYTAKKYAVPALEAHCVEFLTKHLRADNAFMLLTQARLFDEPQLASLCLDTIDKNTMDAISAEGFTDIDIDTLCAVLERDTLSIRECRLFGAVVRWAEAECQRQQLPMTFGNKQKVLGKALSLIRFPLMTIEEFAAGPAQSGILSDREVVNLFLHFTVNPKPRVEYIDRPRCCLRGKECCINRFQQVESRWGYSGTSDRIRFTVNRRISIVGFGLYGSIHGPTDYQVNIQIIEYEKKQTLGQNDTGFSCDGTANTFRVMFKEPIEILPNLCYMACATLKVRVFLNVLPGELRGLGFHPSCCRVHVSVAAESHSKYILGGSREGRKLGAKLYHGFEKSSASQHSSAWEEMVSSPQESSSPFEQEIASLIEDKTVFLKTISLFSNTRALRSVFLVIN